MASSCRLREMRPRSLALALVWLTALAVSLGDAEDKDASVKELSEHVSKGEEDINKALSVSQPGDDISDATMIQQDSCLSKMHALGLRVEKMQGVIQALEAKVGVAKVHGPAPAPVTSTPEKAPQLQRQVMSRGDHKENDRAWVS